MKIKGARDFKKKSYEKVKLELEKLKIYLCIYGFFSFLTASISLYGIYFIVQELLQNQKVLSNVFLGTILELFFCALSEEVVRDIYKRILDNNELLVQMKQNENENNFRLESSKKEMVRERKLEIV